MQGKADAAKAVLFRADDYGFGYTVVWDMDRARAAGLAGKGVWKSSPQAMLRTSAITEVIRMGPSEVLTGVSYTPGKTRRVRRLDRYAAHSSARHYRRHRHPSLHLP